MQDDQNHEARELTGKLSLQEARTMVVRLVPVIKVMFLMLKAVSKGGDINIPAEKIQPYIELADKLVREARDSRELNQKDKHGLIQSTNFVLLGSFCKIGLQALLELEDANQNRRMALHKILLALDGIRTTGFTEVEKIWTEISERKRG